ncbi:MAG TPA: hypothetical protein VF800_02925 [Telluria sp.]|jgi:hypothetical protein
MSKSPIQAAIDALTDTLAMINHFTMRIQQHVATMQKCRDTLAALQVAPSPGSSMPDERTSLATPAPTVAPVSVIGMPSAPNATDSDDITARQDREVRSFLDWCIRRKGMQVSGDDVAFHARRALGVLDALPGCHCATCHPHELFPNRMILCAMCGNKRCPHAANHRNDCTGSNEPGQIGSYTHE